MFFSWLFLLFLASYGFSEAESKYVAESFGAGSFEEMDFAQGGNNNYAQFRAESEKGQDILNESLRSAVDVLKAAVETTNSVKRNGFNSMRAADAEKLLQAKIQVAEEFAKKLEIHNEGQKTARQASEEADFHYN